MATSSTLRELPSHSVGQRAIVLSEFQRVAPRFQTPQAELLKWLAAAHARAGGIWRRDAEAALDRYGASPDQIAFRGHELADFTHGQWDLMRLFGGPPADIARKLAFFDEAVDGVFNRFYPDGALAPSDLIHVTCTGYSAPSGAQRLVSRRRWGQDTQVLHAYHMG